MNPNAGSSISQNNTKLADPIAGCRLDGLVADAKILDEISSRYVLLPAWLFQIAEWIQLWHKTGGMKLRTTAVAAIAGALFAFGCKNNQPAPGATSEMPAETANPMNAGLVGRVHWLGQRAVFADPAGAGVTNLWALAQHTGFASQTLEKLSQTPWQLRGLAIDTNATAMLRPLLTDLVENEFYLEIGRPKNALTATNEAGQLALAIRLDDVKAAMWDRNLAAVMESLTATRSTNIPGQPGWTLTKHHEPRTISLTRLEGWTFVGAASDRNALLEQMMSRTRHRHLPYAPEPSGAPWLRANLDFIAIAHALSYRESVPEWLPAIDMTVAGAGTNVATRAEFRFNRPLPLEFEPWDIPTNMIDSPVTTLTMARGFKDWLGNQAAWQRLGIGAPPNQCYVWAEQGLQMLTLFAAPLADASNRVAQITDTVIERSGSVIPHNEFFGFRRADNWVGLQWTGLGYIWPYLRYTNDTGGPFLVGGFFPYDALAELPPPAIPSTVLTRTNLIYYDWEVTGQRVEDWLHMAQVLRYVSHLAQLKQGSPGLEWLRSIRPKSGKSVTSVYAVAPDRLLLERTSTYGFTGIELHLIADWLESPTFPLGLHTFRAPPDKWPSETMPPAE